MKNKISIPTISKKRFFAAFVCVIVLFGAGLYLYYTQAIESHRKTIAGTIQAIADQKISEISQWHRERVANARSVQESPFLSEAILAWAARPSNTVLKNKISARLNIVKREYGYYDIFMTSPEGSVILTLNGSSEKLDSDRGSIEKAKASHDIVERDFYKSSADGNIYYDILAPLRKADGTTVAILVFRTNPNQYFYPLIRKWPTPSNSAETVLLRKDGDSILYLNDLRFKDHTALALRMPLSSTDLPAVQAALGKRGFFDGYDYRNVHTLSYLADIPHTPWLVVSKIDHSEITSELTYRTILLMIISAIGFLLFGAIFFAYYRSYQLSISADALARERERRKFHEDAEKQIRESEERYKALVEQAADGIFLTDNEGKILEVNTSGAAMLGYTREELHHIPMYALFKLQNPRQLLAQLIKAYTGKPIVREALMIRKDGSELPIEFSWKMMAEDRMQSIVRDITDRIQYEKELRESRELLAETERVGRIGGWAIDVGSMKQTWTDETFDILEYDHDDGEPDVPEGVEFIAPEYRQSAHEAVRNAIEHGIPFDQEWEVITARGHRKWVHSVAQIQKENGAVKFITGAFQDITRRKQAEIKLAARENEYSTLVDKLDEGFCVIEVLFNVEGKAVDYRFLETNPAFLKQTGLTDPFRKTMKEMVPNHEESWYELYGTVVRTGESVRTQAPALALNKHYNVFAYRIGPEGSHKVGVIFSDITERLEMEKLLRDVQRREAVGVLSAGIAHDFNNLLSVMMGNVSLAQMQLPQTHPVYPYLTKSLTAMETAADLTRQILAYAGKGKFEYLTIDLGTEIRQYVSLFNVSKPKNVRLITELSSTPVNVNGDPGQIRQIIMNLIINGGEAIGEAQGTVRVRLDKIDLGEAEANEFGRITGNPLHTGSYAMLEVSDTGIGMKSETLAKIFDPFFTTKFTGRGLGLSAVLGIIRSHEGGIRIMSEVGKGTTFQVILPAVAPQEAPAGGDAPAEDSRPVPAAGLQTVFVIDDEEDVAQVCSDILELNGYRVLTESNPLHAIEVYKENRNEIAVVLLDFTMPELSGKDVAERLHGIDPEVRIIIASGYSEDEIIKKLGTVQVSASIQKPYTMDQLLAKVRASAASASEKGQTSTQKGDRESRPSGFRHKERGPAV